MIKSVNTLLLKVKLLKDCLVVKKCKFSSPFKEIINNFKRNTEHWMDNLAKLTRNLATGLLKTTIAYA